MICNASDNLSYNAFFLPSREAAAIQIQATIEERTFCINNKIKCRKD